MPRYIDVDHVNEQLKKWKRGCEEDNSEEAADSFQDCIHLIRDTHTADVVPRAEYEKVKAENAELKRRLEQQLKEIYFKLGKLMDIHLKRETEYEERGEKDMEFYSHARYMGIYDAQFMILEEIKRYAQGEG